MEGEGEAVASARRASARKGGDEPGRRHATEGRDGAAHAEPNPQPRRPSHGGEGGRGRWHGRGQAKEPAAATPRKGGGGGRACRATPPAPAAGHPRVTERGRGEQPRQRTEGRGGTGPPPRHARRGMQPTAAANPTASSSLGASGGGGPRLLAHAPAWGRSRRRP